jgi:capsular polysaccharide biosynthesis protein
MTQEEPLSTMHPLPNVETPDDLRSREDGAARRSTFARMEVSDYLRIIKKRIWFVLLVPAVAVALVVAIVLGRPTEYSATATVSASSLISSAPGDAYATANGGQQFVADFVAALSVPPVVDAAAARTGTSPEEIREGISAGPIGESTLVQVGFVTNEQRQAGPVVRELSVEALRFLFRPAAATADPTLDEGSLLPTQRLELLLEQDETVTVSPTQVESRSPDLVRGVQVAIGGGLLLGLLVVILLEILPLDRLAGRSSSLLTRLAQLRGSTTGREPDPRGDMASVSDVTDARVRTRPPDPSATRADRRANDVGLDQRRSALAATRQPDEPPVEPLTGKKPAVDPEAGIDRRRTTKPRTAKARRGTPREPATRDASAAPSPEPAAPDTGSTTGSTPHAEAPSVEPPPAQAPAEVAPKPPGARKRRPSRADARRTRQSGDAARPGPSPGEPDEQRDDGLEAGGPAHDAGIEGSPRAAEQDRARDA